MALDKEHKYVNEITQQEHDDTANIELKKVGAFGWNSDSLEWKRIQADANGKIAVNTNIDATDFATETTLFSADSRLAEANTHLGVIENSVALNSSLINGTQLTQIVNGVGNVADINSSGEMSVVMHGHVSTNNSTSTTLLANDTFTGTAEEVLDIAEITVNVKASHASATNGLVIEFSPDGTNWDNSDTYTIPAATGKTFSSQRSGRYLRVRYTNGSTNQTYFRLEVILNHMATKPSSHRVQDTISDDDDGELGISVLKLRTAQNNYVSGSATNNGNFKVSLEEYNGNIATDGLPIQDGGRSITTDFTPANLSAFGTLETAELTPVIQGDWVYGINTQIWSTPVVSGTGATVDTNSSRLRIQSGTSSTGYAYITSKRPVRYRAGEGTVVRITPLFTTGVANNIQLWGIGSIANNAPYDGYFFGYNGDSFGIAHYNRGTPTWYTQSNDWNGDKVNGTNGASFIWDKTKGVPVMIKYPYLGYGNIFFYVQNPNTGLWVLVHTIQYANTLSTTQLSNPTLQVMGYTINSGNTTNVTMYSGSVGAFISGVRSIIANPKWAIDNSKTGITTETAILNIKNASSFNGVTNRGLLRLGSLSISATANTSSIVTVKLKIGATIGGSPSYTTINGTTADGGATITSGNSIASYDIAGTTVSGGTYVFNANASAGQNGSGGVIVDLTPYEIFVAPSEILTISASCTSSASVGVSINWSEDI